MITPKTFQQTYIENVLGLFLSAKGLYDSVTTEHDRRRVFAYNGALLMKAPTGAGKTIMAGAVAEKFSAEEKVVWFWFAPFKGLVGQAAASLRDHHPGLRVRDLATDRRVNGTCSGDTFVLTWASVVARSADARKIRKDNEQLPALDDFLADLRIKGFRIGIIIDEAHHGIGAQTQSVEFFREVLIPDYSLMITATPDDADADKFIKAAGIRDLHRVTVSREEAVLAGLVKEGVKSIAYISPPDQAVLADFEAAALQDACTMHARIKQELEKAGIALVPLMMVQVSKEKGSIEETKAALLKLAQDAPHAYTRTVFVNAFHGQVPVGEGRRAEHLGQKLLAPGVAVEHRVFAALLVVQHKLHRHAGVGRPLGVGRRAAIAEQVARVARGGRSGCVHGGPQ